MDFDSSFTKGEPTIRHKQKKETKTKVIIEALDKCELIQKPDYGDCFTCGFCKKPNDYYIAQPLLTGDKRPLLRFSEESSCLQRSLCFSKCRAFTGNIYSLIDRKDTDFLHSKTKFANSDDEEEGKTLKKKKKEKGGIDLDQ